MTPYGMPTLLFLVLVAKPLLSDIVSPPPTWTRNGSLGNKAVSLTTAEGFASKNTPTVDTEASESSGVATTLQKEGIPPASVSSQPIKPFSPPTATGKETTSPNGNTSTVECITSTMRPLTVTPETDSTTLVATSQPSSTMESSNGTRSIATGAYDSGYEEGDSSENVDVTFPQTYPTSNPATSAPRYPPTSLTTTTTQMSMLTTTILAATMKKTITSSLETDSSTPLVTSQPSFTMIIEMHQTLPKETKNIANSTYPRYENRGSSENVGVTLPQTYPTSNGDTSPPTYPPIFPTTLTTKTPQTSLFTNTMSTATTTKITPSSEIVSTSHVNISQPSSTMKMEMHHTSPNETRNIANSTYPSGYENRGSSENVGVTFPRTYPTSNTDTSPPTYPPAFSTTLTTTTTTMLTATTTKTTPSSKTDSTTPMVPSQPFSTMKTEMHHTLPNETKNIVNSTYPSGHENRGSSENVGVTSPQTYPTSNAEMTYPPRIPLTTTTTQMSTITTSMSGTSVLTNPPKTHSTPLTATTTPRSMPNSVSRETTTETIRSNVSFVTSPAAKTVPTSPSITSYTSSTGTVLPTAISNVSGSVFSTTMTLPVTSTVTKFSSQGKTVPPSMSNRSTPTQETESLYTTMLHRTILPNTTSAGWTNLVTSWNHPGHITGTIMPDEGRTTSNIERIATPGTTRSTESNPTVLASPGTGIVVLRLNLESSSIYPLTTQAIIKLICSMLVQQLSAKNTTVSLGTQRTLTNCDTF